MNPGVVADCCEDEEEETVLCEEGGGYEGHGRKFTGSARAENSDAKHCQTHMQAEGNSMIGQGTLIWERQPSNASLFHMQHRRTRRMAALSVRISTRKNMHLRRISASTFRVE